MGWKEKKRDTAGHSRESLGSEDLERVWWYSVAPWGLKAAESRLLPAWLIWSVFSRAPAQTYAWLLMAWAKITSWRLGAKTIFYPSTEEASPPPPLQSFKNWNRSHINILISCLSSQTGKIWWPWAFMALGIENEYQFSPGRTGLRVLLASRAITTAYWITLNPFHL